MYFQLYVKTFAVLLAVSILLYPLCSEWFGYDSSLSTTRIFSNETFLWYEAAYGLEHLQLTALDPSVKLACSYTKPTVSTQIVTVRFRQSASQNTDDDESAVMGMGSIHLPPMTGDSKVTIRWNATTSQMINSPN